MNAQTIKLNMTPGGLPAVVYVSKYDVGRPIAFDLVEGRQKSPFEIPSGAVVSLRATKPDGHGVAYGSADEDSPVSYTVTYDPISGDCSKSLVAFLTTMQFCAAAGTGRGEIRIEKDSGDVGSANFIFIVEEAGLSDGTDMSETEVPEIIDAARRHAAAAAASAEDSEAWAVGKRSGADVDEEDPAYHNNSKYFSQQAAGKASEASTSAQNAAASATTAGNYASAVTSAVAPVEAGQTSSAAYAVGKFIIFGGHLCEVTQAIAVGDTLAVGTNLYDTSAGDELSDLKSAISSLGLSVVSGAVNITYEEVSA